jgi:hypothetical protein
MAVAKEASTRCATKLAGAPLDLGEAESFVSKFAKNAAGAAVSKALSSALGGFLGGGGGGEKKPPLYKDQVKKNQKVDFTDPTTDTRIKLGGMIAQDGLLVSARVDKADGKGTFHTVFLERPDCVRIFPVKQMGYELWGKWTLNVSITKTTSHYQDGVLTSQSVEKSGWSKSGTFDFSKGISIVETGPLGESMRLVLDPDQAYLNQLRNEIERPLWQEMGYGAPTEGLRSLGAVFDVTPADLTPGTIAVVHVTHVEKGRYATVGFPLKMDVGPEGALAFTQL